MHYLNAYSGFLNVLIDYNLTLNKTIISLVAYSRLHITEESQREHVCPPLGMNTADVVYNTTEIPVSAISISAV